MRYNISNDPNYEEKERARIQEQNEKFQIENKRRQRELEARTNSYLDAIQRALDNKQYKSYYLDVLHRKLAIQITFNNIAYSMDKEALDNAIRIIKSKYPKWDVVSFDNRYNDRSADSNYGIRIIGRPKDIL